MNNRREYAESSLCVLSEKLSVLCGKKIILMEKKKYISPRIEWIPLDNEISLVLESSPPEGPGEISENINSQINTKTQSPFIV